MRTRAGLFTVLTCLAAGPVTRPTTDPTTDQRVDQLLAPPTPAPAAHKPVPPAERPPKAVAGVVPYVREGTTVVDQFGTLGHTADAKQAVFTFAQDPADPAAPRLPAMVVLPDLNLEAMERQQASAPATTFRVAGLVTEYKGRNYLRVDRVTGASSDALLPLPADTALERTSGHGAVAPGSAPRPLVPDGNHLSTRTGRLNLSADGEATVTFDADGRTMADPPMVIQPNLKLMQMEGQRTGLYRDAQFRVSGSVSEYHGRNYVLLDKAVAAADFDSKF